jgi:hypothetical protein
VSDARSDAEEAAAVLRRLLAATESGELQADGPLGAGLVRQMRGAAAALEAVAESADELPPGRPFH